MRPLQDSCYDGPAHFGHPAMEHASSPTSIFRFGLFEANVAQRSLTRNGVRVKIQDQPFRVLVLLLEHPGEIVGREELKHQLWTDGTFVDFDGSLNVILKKLRSAIDDNSENPRFIETVPRQGYRFIAPVTLIGGLETVPAAMPAVQPKDSVPLPPPPPPARFSQNRLLIAGLAVVLLSALLAGWLRWPAAKPGAIVSSHTASPPVQVRESVAILGFHNTSGRGSDDWMSTALAEMLSTELAGGNKLRLVSGEEVSNLRAFSPWSQTGTLDRSTTSKIGTALGSEFLVLGSYATIGKPERGQLRVDVRLQDARSGEILSEIAEIGKTDDLFVIVSRIGGQLRDRLKIPHLNGSEESVVQAALPSNSEAARFYSLGLVKQREYDFEMARGLFEQAIASEPGFPLSYSMLSRTDMLLGHYDQARTEAKQGLDLDGGLPRVQKMEIEASYYQATGDRAKAADIYRVLFNLFPDSLDYGLQLAKLLLESNRPDESLATIRQLRQLPPPAGDDASLDLREAGIQLRKNMDSAERLFHTAAEKAIAQGKKQVYAKAEQGICYINRKHLQSPPECEQAYETFQAAGNRDQVGATLQIMAENQRLTGHDQDAIPLYNQAIRMLKAAGDHEGVGVALNNLSLVLENQGQWGEAEESYREARQNFLSLNDKNNTFIATANIADIQVMRGNLQKAADMYKESWEIADASEPVRDEYPHLQHATLLLMEGDLAQATTEIQPVIASLRAWGADPWQLANSLILFGDIQKAQGDLTGARKNYEESVDILKKANASTANPQLSLAELSTAEGHPDAAEPILRNVIAEYEKDKNVSEELDGYVALCRALLAQGKMKESEETIAHAEKLVDLREFPTRSLPLQLLKLRVKAAAYGNTGADALTASAREMRAVLQRAHQIGFYTEECEARLALGGIETKISPALGRSHLSALVSEAHQRGFELVARQAEKIAPQTAELAAVDKSAR
jgi:DNA-binding winged helix-turn-helix (wHTH) protein/tetratricopeptide (TPR) repeat protein